MTIRKIPTTKNAGTPKKAWPRPGNDSTGKKNQPQVHPQGSGGDPAARTTTATRRRSWTSDVGKTPEAEDRAALAVSV